MNSVRILRLDNKTGSACLSSKCSQSISPLRVGIRAVKGRSGVLMSVGWFGRTLRGLCSTKTDDFMAKCMSTAKRSLVTTPHLISRLSWGHHNLCRIVADRKYDSAQGHLSFRLVVGSERNIWAERVCYRVGV